MTAPAHKLPVARDRAKILTPRWDWRKWGTLEDPCHKSQLSTLVGEWACTKQFQFDRIRDVVGEDRNHCSGKTEMGTAGHETIARALRSPHMRATVLAGAPNLTFDTVRRVVLEEFGRATAGKEVIWYGKHEQEAVLHDVAWMAYGALMDLSRHVAAIELIEAGCIVQLGDFWIEGHVDLVFRPRDNPEGLGLTDWKTGAQKPHQLVLDHGYESGFYSAALERGLFLPLEVLRAWRAKAQAFVAGEEHQMPLELWDVQALATARTEREAMHVALRGLARKHARGDELPAGVVRFGRFPDAIRLTHLADYIPYERKGAKTVERPEDVEFWSRVFARPVQPGEKVHYEKGMWRGAAWLRVRRGPEDVQRLEKLLRAVVGWVRMGKFVESIGEKCTRCPYKGPCLTSGYEVDKDAAKELNAALRGLDLGDADGMNVDD